jgi:predicted RNA-binding Zn ribbon-like protein
MAHTFVSGWGTGYTFVSGDLALDFAGTLQHRRADRLELMRAPADLARWITAAGLLTTAPEPGPADLAHALALREAIYRSASAAMRGRRPADADRTVINAAAAVPPPVPYLPGAAPAEDAERCVERAGDVGAALSLVARAAIDLLGGAATGTLKQCEGDPCTRLYLDGSRHGTRRWCDMRRCGNRANAAAFRARRHT